ncbi:MAG: transposase, partial [Gammaproteobacteria bacterium]
EGLRKNTDLFLRLLEHLKRTYRGARKIVLIADNYIIHKSNLALAWLKQYPKFEILFQPAYQPWVNDIEKLWKQLHDNITRNHRYSTVLINSCSPCEPIYVKLAPFQVTPQVSQNLDQLFRRQYTRRGYLVPTRWRCIRNTISTLRR